MFFPAVKVPRKPAYSNPDAEEGTRERGEGELTPWEFGKEIDLYNSRNIYTRGGAWRRRDGGGVPWVDKPSPDYVEFSSDMVTSTMNPRLLWGGWTRGWREKSNTVRAEQLFVHRDDVYPRPQSRFGKGSYKTRRIREAWESWAKVGGVGVRWCGDGYLEVEYASVLDEDALLAIGWKMTQGDTLVDIDTPLPRWVLEAGILLPGHDPTQWAGVSNIKIKFSGAEGCVPESFTVDDPGVAGESIAGSQALPLGCEVRVNDRYSLGLYHGRCVPWLDGKVSVPARRMVPLKKGVKSVSLHIPHGGKATYLVDPNDIDFARLRRPVICTYFAKGGEEKCLITPDAGRMKTAGAVTRTKVVEDPGMFYRVVAPLPSGKNTSTQKMAGGARVGRLPSLNKGERERLEAAYGDVVGHDYYLRDEDYFREAARLRDEALSAGYLDIASARRGSAVPPEVFDRLVARGTVQARTLPTGKKYFRPVGFTDISDKPRLAEEIAKIAVEDNLGWLCQIIVAHPREFSRALVNKALAPR